jgi:hypothetical protein
VNYKRLPPQEVAEPVTWVRLDDGFARHPKVAAAGPLAMAMQVAALCYCNQELTDGFVPRAVARTLLNFESDDGQTYWMMRVCTDDGRDEELTAEFIWDCLISAGMWEKVPGGFRIHDYEDYQPSKEDVLALRDVRAEAGRKGGLQRAAHIKEANEAKAKQVAKQTPSKDVANLKPVPVPVPVPDTEDEENAPLTPHGGARASAPRRKRIPDDWQPSEALCAYAVEWGIPADQVSGFAEEFKLYWLGDGRPKVNWDLAFQGRVRDQAHRYKGRASPNGGARGQPGKITMDDLRSALRPEDGGDVQRNGFDPGGTAIEVPVVEDVGGRDAVHARRLAPHAGGREFR